MAGCDPVVSGSTPDPRPHKLTITSNTQMKYKTRTFEKEFLIDLDTNKNVEIIKEEIIDHTRWSVIYYVTFKYEGKFYGTSYSVGATETQDETPYEYDGDLIECEELEPKEVTIIEYHHIPIA